MALINKVEFHPGDKVFDKIHNCEATVLDNYGNPTDGDRGDIRVDMDGNVPIFEYDSNWEPVGYNLVKLTSKQNYLT